jgi:hypothetical protein
MNREKSSFAPGRLLPPELWERPRTDLAGRDEAGEKDLLGPLALRFGLYIGLLLYHNSRQIIKVAANLSRESLDKASIGLEVSRNNPKKVKTDEIQLRLMSIQEIRGFVKTMRISIAFTLSKANPFSSWALQIG